AQVNQDRQKRAQERLQGVANPKEFQAASREVDQLRKQYLDLEAQKGAFAVDFDKTREAAATAAQLVGEVEQRLQAANASMGSEDSVLAKSQTELEARRAALVTQGAF